MKIKITSLFLLFLICQFSFAQGDKEIRGKLISDSIAVEGINIQNLSNQRGTNSDQEGRFLILVKQGDILVFSAVNIVTTYRKISIEEYVTNSISIQITPRNIVLKEVVINENSQITAENLGIIPFGQKKYTPAERKLYTATSGGGIDGLLNTISGRKAMLKKDIIVEKKVQLLDAITYLFSDKYYLETLKIPADYIKGFQYYCVENTDFAATLKTKNKTMTLFLITQLAENYLQIIEKEKLK